MQIRTLHHFVVGDYHRHQPPSTTSLPRQLPPDRTPTSHILYNYQNDKLSPWITDLIGGMNKLGES